MEAKQKQQKLILHALSRSVNDLQKVATTLNGNALRLKQELLKLEYIVPETVENGKLSPSDCHLMVKKRKGKYSFVLLITASRVVFSHHIFIHSYTSFFPGSQRTSNLFPRAPG
jgi:hypothetical protein